MEDTKEVIPIDRLIDEKRNIYSVVGATVQRARQIALAGDEDLEDNYGKVVSTAMKQILDRKVEFQIEE